MSLISKCTQCGGTSDETIGLCAACRQSRTLSPAAGAQLVAQQVVDKYLDSHNFQIVSGWQHPVDARMELIAAVSEALNSYATQRAGEVWKEAAEVVVTMEGDCAFECDHLVRQDLADEFLRRAALQEPS